VAHAVCKIAAQVDVFFKVTIYLNTNSIPGAFCGYLNLYCIVDTLGGKFMKDSATVSQTTRYMN
jgi:hypothetical protein